MNNSLRQYYLTEIGIQGWQLKSALDTDFNALDYTPLEEKEPIVVSHEPLVASQEQIVTEKVQTIAGKTSVPELPASSAFDTELINNIEACNSCPVRKNRLKPLAGEGNSNASVFFIGDAPTAAAEREGHYLTGDIQSLFNAMLHAIDIENDYFLTGIIKCHSLEEYLITEDEINNCGAHLNSQLEQIKPKVIVALGPVQAQAILKSKESFNQLRNKIHAVKINSNPASSLSSTHSYPVIVSYHPSFLLRNPLYKKEALKDLLLIKNLLADES